MAIWVQQKEENEMRSIEKTLETSDLVGYVEVFNEKKIRINKVREWFTCEL